mmetsp:Transcript_30115/g.69490  ORF Transcript_30115/g.69490 Transcript_30115/m.69490 type:complete len:189 (-) Transcript_30115:323-889(-)
MHLFLIVRLYLEYYHPKHAIKGDRYWMALLVASLLPLQGFWNALIYFRPRIVRYLRKRDSQNHHHQTRPDTPELAVRRSIVRFRFSRPGLGSFLPEESSTYNSSFQGSAAQTGNKSEVADAVVAENETMVANGVLRVGTNETCTVESGSQGLPGSSAESNSGVVNSAVDEKEHDWDCLEPPGYASTTE